MFTLNKGALDALHISHLTKSYKDHKVIDDLSFTFNKKGITIIVGVNGSGKTTLFNLINDLVDKDEGTITLSSLSDEDRKKECFYIPSDFYLPEYMTGKEYVDFILSRYPYSNKENVEWLIHLLDFDEAYHKLIETYSYGMKKKIQIIAAIASNTHYIFADEVFNGLDFETVLLLEELFQKLSNKRAFVLITHEMHLIQRFDCDCYMMKEGKLYHVEDDPLKMIEEIKEEKTYQEKRELIDEHVMSL